MEEWNVFVGDDHGQGAWQSHMKLYTCSPEFRHICNSQAKEKIHRSDKCGYFIFNNSHMDCKKDHPSVLENTVAKDLDASYESLMVSQMVFAAEKGTGSFQWCLLPKYTTPRLIKRELE
jgi:hypothetical protein